MLEMVLQSSDRVLPFVIGKPLVRTFLCRPFHQSLQLFQCHGFSMIVSRAGSFRLLACFHWMYDSLDIACTCWASLNFASLFVASVFTCIVLAISVPSRYKFGSINFCWCTCYPRVPQMHWKSPQQYPSHSLHWSTSEQWTSPVWVPNNC